MALRPTRIPPGPGQESVWDYPRPPRIEPTDRRVRVELGGVLIGDTTRALRVLETSQPPAFYLPPEDVAREHLERTDKHSFCEWKGHADYWTVTVGERVARDAAWSYPAPNPAFVAIADHLAFYPRAMDGCFVDDERVESNDGDFYGGWITSAVVGPFKGAPGTGHW
ncbi:MAG: DUF427 domain-containing protein [Acidimicrobiales bacterium]